MLCLKDGTGTISWFWNAPVVVTATDSLGVAWSRWLLVWPLQSLPWLVERFTRLPAKWFLWKQSVRASEFLFGSRLFGIAIIILILHIRCSQPSDFSNIIYLDLMCCRPVSFVPTRVITSDDSNEEEVDIPEWSPTHPWWCSCSPNHLLRTDYRVVKLKQAVPVCSTLSARTLKGPISLFFFFKKKNFHYFNGSCGGFHRRSKVMET